MMAGDDQVLDTAQCRVGRCAAADERASLVLIDLRSQRHFSLLRGRRPRKTTAQFVDAVKRPVEDQE